MKKLTITTLIVLFVSAITFAWLSKAGSIKKYRSLTTKAISHSPAKLVEKIKIKAAEAAIYTRQKNYNSNICFLVDMSLPSGQNRFFVYDLKKDSITMAGLVAHGRCNENWLEGRKYGNTIGCGCSSLGHYKIGYSYTGRFGLAFKLYGLDKTNDKAFERFVVLHSHSCVPETVTSSEICQSDGCPTVAPGFLQELKPIITHSGKPVLLWIFE